MAMKQDERGWTHVDWALEGVTADMIDWHWANLEKTFFLWHPGQHMEFRWELAPTQAAFLGAVHAAPQVRKDGTRREPIIRYEDVAGLREDIQALVVYDHVCVVAGLDLSGEKDVRKAPIKGYRVHQWSASDAGVTGRSSAVNPHVTDLEAELREGKLWAAHAAEECGNWAVFLPALYKLWRAVPESPINLNKNLRVSRQGGLHYADLR